jgi:hypothetical protein
MSLRVPKVPANLHVSNSAFVRAAQLFRGVLGQAGHGEPIDKAHSERQETLLTAKRVKRSKKPRPMRRFLRLGAIGVRLKLRISTARLLGAGQSAIPNADDNWQRSA